MGPGDAEQILEQRDDQSIRRQLSASGHRFMLDDALEKVSRGVTDLRQVRFLSSGR